MSFAKEDVKNVLSNLRLVQQVLKEARDNELMGKSHKKILIERGRRTIVHLVKVYSLTVHGTTSPPEFWRIAYDFKNH